MLIEAPWPELANVPDNKPARDEMRWVVDLVSGVRSIRAEMNVPPAAKIQLCSRARKRKRARAWNAIAIRF